VLASWNPRAAVGLLGAFAFVSYMLAELGSRCSMAGLAPGLPAFKLYGMPSRRNRSAQPAHHRFAIIIVASGASILLMERRDVGA